MEKTACFFVVIILLTLYCRLVVGDDAENDTKTLSTRSKRVRRAFGYAKACIRKRVKFCRTFTVNGITKRLCIIGKIHRCTSLDR